MKLDLNGQSIDLDFIGLYGNEIEEFSGPDEVDLCRGICPFCQDRKAFYVMADTGGFNCLMCGASGSFIEFMMKKYQVGREEIIQVLTAISNAEPTDEINDAQGEPEALDDNSESSSQQRDSIHMPSELYLSPAFLSLNKNAIKTLIALLSRSRLGNGHLETSYNELQKIYRINRSRIPTAIDELMRKGFLSMIHHGGTGKGDRNLYALSDNYLSWKPGMEPFETRPKRENIEFEEKDQTNLINLEEMKRESKSRPIGKRVRASFQTLKSAFAGMF